MNKKRTNHEKEFTLEPECISGLTLDRTSPLSLGRQLYLCLFEAISCGALPANSVLPATRKLSARLGIARNTVVAAYSQLAEESLVTSEGGRTTRVTYSHRLTSVNNATLNGSMHIPTLSQRSPSPPTGKHFRELTPGEPDCSLFQNRDWQRAMSRAAKLPASELGYGTRGQIKLQNSIARHLAVFRSLIVEPSRIILTSSTRQSLLLAATMYADTGDSVLMESPGYPGAVEAFHTQGLKLVGCDVDTAGTKISNSDVPLKLAYLTPCSHFPLGVPLSAKRRDEFLTLSRECGTVLFEDDYDSEFRDQSQPHPALAAQAETYGASVLHAGTFSKLIFPAARVAWVVVPKPHVEVAWQCLRNLGGGHGVVAQTAVCELLDSGTISRHLQRARQIYTQRSQVLNQSLEQSDLITKIEGGGLTTILTLDKNRSIVNLEKELENVHLGVKPLERFKWQKKSIRSSRHLVIGMGNVDSISLPGAVKRLESAIRRS